MNSNNRLCFVLMPFHEDYDKYFSQIYKPAIEIKGFEAKRADNLYRPSTIIRDIWDFILRADFLIADITGLNSNVMYELGLAHAVGKPVIIISDNIDDVPFDLRGLRILLYDKKQPDWGTLLKEKIENAIEELVASPLDVVLPAFHNIKPDKQEEVGELKSDIIEIKQLLYRQLEDNSVTDSGLKKALNAETYTQALREAYDMYFVEGLDLGDIKNTIRERYNTSIHTASEIVHRAMSYRR